MTHAVLAECCATFEPVVLPGGGPMEAVGCRSCLSPHPRQSSMWASLANVLGRLPLMPLFILGNSTPTVPNQLRQHRRCTFPHGRCSRRVGQEGKQCCGSLGWANLACGPVGGCD